MSPSHFTAFRTSNQVEGLKSMMGTPPIAARFRNFSLRDCTHDYILSLFLIFWRSITRPNHYFTKNERRFRRDA
jgi:hypothetical protein